MSTAIPPRGVGRSKARAGQSARVVDRLVIHGEPLDFRELCRRAVPSSTRYLILDLDHTFHLHRNIGELLGWELCAYRGYGPEYLEAVQERRGPGRFLLDRSRPRALLRYLALGIRMWAGPGLYYLLWGKIASRLETLRRWSFLRFGPEPVRTVQRIPQTALMHQLADLPLATLKQLAERVWQRHAGDQVIDRDDIRWLHERCPDLKVIITSASPRPVLEVAAEQLGADYVAYSSQEEHEGWLSTPFWLSRLFLRRGDPRRISPPSLVRYNASYAKIEHLLARYPELADPDIESVGISDNGYGEDQCWAQYFTRVIDINSTCPFSPVVAVDSPLREIHSALVLTRSELEHRARGEATNLDPRRKGSPGPYRTFDRLELEAMLAGVLAQVEQLAARYQAESDQIAPRLEHLTGLARAEQDAIEEVVATYNDTSRPDRLDVLEQLRRHLEREGALRAQIARLERPVSEIAFGLTRLLEASRTLLNGPLPARRRG